MIIENPELIRPVGKDHCRDKCYDIRNLIRDAAVHAAGGQTLVKYMEDHEIHKRRHTTDDDIHDALHMKQPED